MSASSNSDIHAPVKTFLRTCVPNGRVSWSAAIVTYLATQDFLLLVQESEEIRHMRVMTASQASA